MRQIDTGLLDLFDRGAQTARIVAAPWPEGDAVPAVGGRA